MKLYIGTDSTWSLRALISCYISKVDIDVSLFDLSNIESKNDLKKISPTGLVPLLQDGDLFIYDSISIIEYLNEVSPNLLYPADMVQRVISRSLCAELHSGYLSVRNQMPFVSKKSAITVVPSIQSLAEIKRIESIFMAAQGDFMWGDTPYVVDAFFSVMAYRLSLYGINFSGQAGKYQRTLIEWNLFQKALKSIS